MPYWYQYYFQIERGRAGLAANRRGIAKDPLEAMVAELALRRRDAESGPRRRIDNPDYVDIVIHSYRHRYGLAESDPRYADIPAPAGCARRRSRCRAITLDGEADGVAAATDGSANAAKFTGRRIHRLVPRAGHNLPQEAPDAFVDVGDGIDRSARGQFSRQ